MALVFDLSSCFKCRFLVFQKFSRWIASKMKRDIHQESPKGICKQTHFHLKPKRNLNLTLIKFFENIRKHKISTWSKSKDFNLTIEFNGKFDFHSLSQFSFQIFAIKCKNLFLNFHLRFRTTKTKFSTKSKIQWHANEKETIINILKQKIFGRYVWNCKLKEISIDQTYFLFKNFFFYVTFAV